MDQIPKIANDEEFKAIEEHPGYYISNYKRIYSDKSNRNIKVDKTRFKNNKQEKVRIKPLYDKYFNQPNEEDLIAIIKYNDYKFIDLYYDRVNDKFYLFKNGFYNEITQHDDKRCKAKTIRAYDISGKSIKISLMKFKKSHSFQN